MIIDNKITLSVDCMGGDNSVDDIVGGVRQFCSENVNDTLLLHGNKKTLSEALDKYPSLEGVSADEGYRKTTENFVQHQLKKQIEISKKITNEWSVLAKRWVVERTFSWLNHFRRLAKDFQISLSSAEAFIIISHAAILLQRF